VLPEQLELPARLVHPVLKETLGLMVHKVRVEIPGPLAQQDHLVHQVTLALTALQAQVGHRARLANRVPQDLQEISDQLVILVQMVHQDPRVLQD